MRCVDVNVLVCAHRPESPDHGIVQQWIERARRGPEPLAIAGIVASGFLRIVTNTRIFKDPTPLDRALESLDALYDSPAVLPLVPGERHWGLFTELRTSVRATGNLVPDCYLAALAIEHGATWVTTDRGFARFPGLRLETPRPRRDPTLGTG
ncbi:MAG: type II toxin-antitoxin system VapC family toxin [Acidimicrobiia bacterium]|nr:type II toxin-antitoxin system VapC family toxin [Acidimicrobiia bacterium]